MTGISVIVLRKKRKDLERPYKTIGYPATPLIFILISFFFLVNTLIQKPVQAYAALLCMLLGLPFYFYFKRNR
jgi:APA family basic amino acid/polyamine antiporter